jgi:hypothetical protein
MEWCWKYNNNKQYLFIYSGMPGENEPHIRGVGILINKNIKDALLEWKLVS